MMPEPFILFAGLEQGHLHIPFDSFAVERQRFSVFIVFRKILHIELHAAGPGHNRRMDSAGNLTDVDGRAVQQRMLFGVLPLLLQTVKRPDQIIGFFQWR